MIRYLLPKAVDVSSRFDPDAGRVRVRRDELDRVLLNLVLNARGAMPYGGTLALSTRAFDAPRGTAEDLAPGGYVRIEVGDTGKGMDPALCERAFEPYVSTQEGSERGLGLATVREIVERCGGRVQCASQVGIGTTFRVDLPAA